MRRSSLLVKLLAGSVLVAICSITATAWLAAQTTSGALRQERGRALSDDALIYADLVGYAARHPRWDGIEPILAKLSKQTGRAITLTTQDGRRIAGGQAAGKPSALIDPLAVDPALTPSARPDRIDPRATGPFTLPAAERSTLTAAAERAVSCLARYSFAAKIVTSPSGRPRVDLERADPERVATRMCGIAALNRPTATERKALARLQTLLDSCLDRRDVQRVTLKQNLTWSWSAPAIMSGTLTKAVNSCLDTSRREQLAATVAPAALLYVEASGAGIALLPLAGVAALVLVLTVAVSVVLARRLVGPVRALTAAAHRMRDGAAPTPVDVAAGGEIGELATAFNAMSEHSRQVSEQRKAMVSDIAHELRTPLTNIRGWLEAAEDGVAPMDAALTSRLHKESLLLQHIVDDLQDLAVADAGGLRLHRSLVALDELLDQAVTAHQAPAVVVCPPIVLDADPVRLRQAVGNLVGNAVRFGGTITVTGKVAGDHVEIAVRDTGPGIAPEDLPHVFDRFWRADKSRSRQGGGSGLGLAIVRSIVTAHGGTVTASSPGGACFTISLPYC
ncbi:sensor histidine kinase [Nonomuraea sp. NPDC050556]|uniref:sensor histidine kinase n=1 Tax=Nonomuraea sp. NPDC050556 TaxID=3364369 RepID=UPI0037AD0411